MQLSIIIVSYNVKYFLEQCLHSVRLASAGLAVEIIVVDNASSDGTVAYLQPLFPEVLFLPQQENLGFAKGCNLGWRKSRGRSILFLNPDTILAEDTLHICLDFLKKNPQAGAIGVRMLDGSGVYLKESKRGLPHPLTSLFKLSGLAGLFPHSRLFARYYMGHLPENENHEVDVLAGAFMLIPRTVLQQAGSFDEAFFMYGEDIDLSYRVQKKGFKNYYLAQTTIIHFKGESTRKASLAYVRRFYGAMIIFVQKHYTGIGAALLRWGLQTAIYASAVLSVLRNVFKQGKNELVQQAADALITVAGTEAQYEKLAATLNSKRRQCQYIKSLEEIEALSSGHELVLCAGRYSFKEIIHFVQQHPRAFRFRFHAGGSHSIVGSDNSNSSGETIGLDR